MEYLIIIFIFICCSVICIVSLLYYYLVTRYKNFVINNSRALQDLKALNAQYHFEYISEPELFHTYDNEKFYNSVSCYDYLIYDLQFANNRKIYLDLINKASDNKCLYDEYLYSLKQIKLGLFEMDYSKLKFDKLLKYEHELMMKNQLHPATKFCIHVLLSYVNMGGRFISSKSGLFDEYDVCNAIDLLKDRNNGFYNNKEIWNSLCSVERAKVSNKMRFSIYSRDNYRCQICHRRFNPEQLEIDHIYPIAKGGKSTYDNLQTLCRECNKNKGDKIM